MVNRRVEIDPDLGSFLRGSSALASASLEATLLAAGASEAECRSSDSFDGLAVSCRYRYALLPADGSAVQPLPLPDDSLFQFLAELPVEAARGVHLSIRGQVATTGFFTRLPDSRTQRYANGGYVHRRYSLASFSTLTVDGEIRLPPGNPAEPFVSQRAVAGFIPRYVPPPSAWLALGFALLSALAAIKIIFPVSARLPREPRPWPAHPERIPFLLRWLAALVAHLTNWLRHAWMRLLNWSLGVGLIIAGVQTVVIAWGLAQLYERPDDLRQLYDRLFADVSLAGISETIESPGFPIALAIIGAVASLIGLGLLARRDTARLLIAGAGIGLLGGLILAWPHLLLAPLQLERILWSGEIVLIVLTILIRGLTHPRFRRYYAAQSDAR